MNDILNTIEVLTSKVRTKEEEANKLKKLVNELCAEAGTELRYPGISETTGDLGGIRSDQFYSLTLTAAIRNYLEYRKACGLSAASVAEIFRAVKFGGYKFVTKSEENAKIAVGNALRKTSSIFHRLPNGQYGLLAWYSSVKPPPESNATGKAKGKRSRSAERPAGAETPPKANGGNSVTNREIRDVILAQQGEFHTADIVAAVKTKLPSKGLPTTKIPSMIFSLKDKGILREVSPRSGKKQAVYAKT